jgi:repressor LexA
MLSKWENCKEEPLKFKDVVAIADYFKVTSDYLIGLTDNKYSDENGNMKKVPILGNIAAGVPILCQEDVKGYEYVSLKDNVDFCLIVKGDSMINARIMDGDIVCVKVQSNVENGEIAVVQIDGESATLKRFYKHDGMIILKPENPKYKDIVFTSKDKIDIKILGKAMFIKSSI